MSIGQTIRAVIGLSVPEQSGAFHAPPVSLPPELERQHHAALIDAARERLRAAHADRAAAQVAHTEADAKVARALEVLEDSRRLDVEAAQAESLARDAARAWAAAGCPEEGRPDPDLLDHAATAANAALDARTVAAGAQDALSDLRQAAQSARIDFAQAEERVRAAVLEVLRANAEPRLAELERLRDLYEAALRPVAALQQLVRAWGPAAELHGFSSIEVNTALDRRLKQLAPETPSETDLRGTALDLRDQALALLKDAAATLDA